MINSRNVGIDKITITIMFMYSFMPIVCRFISDYLTTYFYLIVLFFILVITLFSENDVFPLNEKLYILLPFIIWKFLMLLVNTNSFVNFCFAGLQDLLPLLVGIYILYCKRETVPYYAWLLIFIITITSITTVIGLENNPGYARILASSSSESAIVKMNDYKNIAGYSLTYSLVLIYPIIIYAHKIKAIRLIPTVIISLGIMFVAITTEYTIAFLFLIVLSCLYLVKRKLNQKHVIFLFIIAILCIALFWNNISDILFKIADSLESQQLAARTRDLAGGWVGLEASEDDRLRRYMLSLNQFLSHPILGNYFSGGAIGGHSFILDMLARFGIIGGAVLIGMYKAIYKLFYRPYKDDSSYGYVCIIFDTAILLAFVNPTGWVDMLTLFVPVLVSFFNSKVKVE